jgi:cyclin-dependent kinase 12/13
MGFRHKQSEDAKKTVNYFSGPLYQRPSHSGLLVPDSGRHKYGKEASERFLPVSNKVDSKPSRTSLSRNQKKNPASLSPQDTTQVQKSLGLSNGSESRRRHDRKRHSQIVDLSQTENGKVGHHIQTSILFSFSSIMIVYFISFTICQHSIVKTFASHQQLYS